MTVVRLWERQEVEGLVVSVLERSEAELARVAFLGRGEVFDVEVGKSSKPLRQEAEALLVLSRRKVDETDDRAGAVARARKSVKRVHLPAAPARIKRGAPVVAPAKEG